MTTYVVEMNEWCCGLHGGEGNLLAFVSFCDKNTGVRVIVRKIRNVLKMFLNIIVSFG